MGVFQYHVNNTPSCSYEHVPRLVVWNTSWSNEPQFLGFMLFERLILSDTAAPRHCVASRAGIRIIISRACQALCSELSVLPLGEVASVEGPKVQKDGFTGRDSWGSLSAGSPCLVIHTWCPPVRVGCGSRASDRLANQVSSEYFFMFGHFAWETGLNMFCDTCPWNSISPIGRTAITACLCNAGSASPNGDTCVLCTAGTYKSVTGSTACLGCPVNSRSQIGDTAITACVCNAGFPGPNGEPCGTTTSCAADSYLANTVCTLL